MLKLYNINSALEIIEYLYHGQIWAMFDWGYNYKMEKMVLEVLVDYSKALLPFNEADKLTFCAKNYIRIRGHP